MKKSKQVYHDKVYRLRRDAAPLSYMLASKHTKRKALLHFDEETGVNRSLRYARNQKSIFEDEQDGNAILEPIIFEEGMLRVSRQNQILQQFLELHPGNGNVFYEVNNEQDAAADMEIMNFELEAQVAARDLTLAKLESISRVVLGVRADKMTTAELKRDIMVFARRDPQEFLDLINDPMVGLQDEVVKMFSATLLQMRNKNRDVYFNLKKNKTKMLTVPHGEEPSYIVASYFQTDEGVESYKLLKKMLDK
tara:strand:- start:1185 stop:1937 length:753 start_codon:yes stop_codon:yes gene_type:complete